MEQYLRDSENIEGKVSPGFAFPSLVWTKEKERELYDRIDKIMQPKDYIRYRLTGAIGTEVTDASSTLIFDMKKRQWAYSVAEVFGIDKNIFPHVMNPRRSLAVLQKRHRRKPDCGWEFLWYSAGEISSVRALATEFLRKERRSAILAPEDKYLYSVRKIGMIKCFGPIHSVTVMIAAIPSMEQFYVRTWRSNG